MSAASKTRRQAFCRGRWLPWALLACLAPAAAARAAPPADAPPSASAEPSAQPLAPDLRAAAWLGRPVLSVEVEAPVSENAVALAALIDIQPGFLLEGEAVQAAIERLYALGRFAQVEARVLPFGEAVILRLVVTPLLRLERLVLRGLKKMSDDALLRALALQPGDEVDSQTAARLRERLKAHAAQVGFVRAEAQISVRPGASHEGRIVEIWVQEGAPCRMGKVTLVGTPWLPKHLLYDHISARPGRPLDLQAIDRDVKRLEALLWERGFVRAEVRRISPSAATPAALRAAAEAEKRRPSATAPPPFAAGPVSFDPGAAAPAPGPPSSVDVTLQVTAHERITFAYRGNRLLDDEALTALWPGRLVGTPAAALPLFAQRIRSLYARESYPNAEVQVRCQAGQPRRPGLPRPRHTVQIDVEVHEGAPVWVNGVRLKGASTFPHDILRRQVRAVLARELGEPTFFSALGSGAWQERTAPSYGRGWAPHRVPVESRWVPELYARAAADMAAAYQALGFLSAEVAAPSYAPLALGPGQRQAQKQARAVLRGRLLDAKRQGDADSVRSFVGNAGPPPPGPIEAVAQLQVHEGEQTFVEGIRFVKNEQIGGQELLSAIHAATCHYALAAPVAPGAPFSEQGVEDARIAIVRRYRERGYVYVRVFAEVRPVPNRAAMRLTFSVEEGPEVRVQHVLVRGNRHTREGIIRSRIGLESGKIYRLDRAIADQKDIMALGTFSRARVKLVDEDHPSENKDVVAEVEERPRQPIEVVPGLSTASGPRLQLSYAHINLFGTASSFVASLKVNRQIFFRLYGPYGDTLRDRFAAYRGFDQLRKALDREVRVGLRSPPIKAIPSDPLLRLDVVDQRVNAVRYSLDATTATFGIDANLSGSVRLSLEVQGGITELECPLGDNCDQNPDVRRLRGGRPIQEGRRHTIKFGPLLRYDRRDDPVSPKSGFVVQARVNQAYGAARPEKVYFPFAFTKYEGSITNYLPAFGAVFASSFRLGAIVLQRSAAPVDERFYLGGRDSLRGFVEGTLIAQDACVVADPEAPLPPHCAEGIAADPSPPLSLGGNTFALLKNELRLPLAQNLSFDLFVDLGNLWVDIAHAQGFHLRVGTGVGLRYATPVGAMTFDFGVNPLRRAINHEPGWQLHFSIGSF